MKFFYTVRVFFTLFAATTLFAEPAVAVSATRFSLSVDNRVGKHGFVAAEVATPGGHMASGVRAGYFLTPDSILEASHLMFEDEVAGGADVKAQQTGVSYKTFFTNSLLAGAGVTHQSWDMEKEAKSRTTLTVHAGNQWQWTMATLGCDWFTYLLPIGGAAPSSDGAGRFQFLRAYAGISF